MTRKNNHQRLGLWLFSFLYLYKAHGDPMLRIVGSSSVFPFAATVAEHFSYKTHEPIPLIEAVGTGAGIKLFCSDLQGPDGVIASRPFTSKEEEKCHNNGVTFEKFTIGQDGLVVVQPKKDAPVSLTLQDLNRALSQEIQKEKTCLKNPHKDWKDIQPSFPSTPLRVLGPAPNSGTYDVLVEKLDNKCGPFLRADGAYIEAPANENLIIQKVLNAPNSLGIVTFSFYENNKSRLNGLSINGVSPSLTSIQEGSYPLSRPLYLYIKTNLLAQHPSRRSYALEFTSPEAIGDKGYLLPKGLIPLSPREQKEMRERAQNL